MHIYGMLHFCFQALLCFTNAALPHPCTLPERAAFVNKLQGAAAKIAPDVACLSASIDAVSQWGIRAAQYFAEDPSVCPPERLCGTTSCVQLCMGICFGLGLRASTCVCARIPVWLGAAVYVHTCVCDCICVCSRWTAFWLVSHCIHSLCCACFRGFIPVLHLVQPIAREHGQAARSGGKEGTSKVSHVLDLCPFKYNRNDLMSSWGHA